MLRYIEPEMEKKRLVFETIDRVLVKNQSAGLAVSSSIADIVRFSQQTGSLT